MQCEICKENKATMRIGHKKEGKGGYIYVDVCARCYLNDARSIDKLLYIKMSVDLGK